MLWTFLDKVGGFFDKRFMVAYWGPTLIILGLAVGLAGVLIGLAGAIKWWGGLSGIEQGLLTGAALLAITLLAYLLEMLTIPVIRLYEGYWPKGWLTNSMRSCQQKKALKAMHDNYVIRYYNFPRDLTLLKPTRLGNVLAATEEYSYRLYQLDSVLWWPRLATLLPDTFRTQVDTALTPMVAMLNLSIMFTLLALGGGIVVLAIHWPWWWLSLIIFIGGLFLAWACYKAALSQAADYGALIRVAFDLYRQKILKQMSISVPDNLVDERRLWGTLNAWVYYYIMPWDTDAAAGVPRLASPFYYHRHNGTPAATPSQDKATSKDRRNSSLLTLRSSLAFWKPFLSGQK